jgi:peptide/nickel transport system permease protein
MSRLLLRRPWLPAAAAGLLLLTVLLALLVVGLLIPSGFVDHVYLIGKMQNGNWAIPPFQPLADVNLYYRNGVDGPRHLYLFGSDAGGRDLLALIARGAFPSLALVGAALVARFVVGVLAGVAMAMGSTPVRALSRGMGRWFAGFPYLAFAIVLIQAVGPHGRFAGFALAMAAVGWRDIAEITADHVEHILTQPYTEAAHALGSRGWTYFRRHVIPHLVPALAVEMPFQASAVLVLLGELGYLNVYLGNNVINLLTGPNGAPAYRLAATPELGAMLSDARNYILSEQWVPVLVPALAIALLGLCLELFGRSARQAAQHGEARLV